MKRKTKHKLKTIGLLALIVLLSPSIQAQSDSIKTKVIENKVVKIKIYDQDQLKDSSIQKEIKFIQKDIEADMAELEEELMELQEELSEMEFEIEEEIMNGDTVHNFKFQFGENHGKPKKPKLVETESFVMDLGLNTLIHDGGLEMPTGYEEMAPDKLGSFNFHLGIVQQGVNLYRGKLRFVYGIGIEYNNYRFTEHIDLIKGSNPLAYTVNDNIEYRKNKLVSQYLTMPLMLNFKSNPNDEDESLNIAAGIQLGYLVDTHTKQKWGRGSDKVKSKTRGNYQMEDFRYGYVVQFGYGDFNLFAKYYPGPVFKDGRGPNVQTASLGLVLTPF
jgi:hypothetical protein